MACVEGGCRHIGGHAIPSAAAAHSAVLPLVRRPSSRGHGGTRWELSYTANPAGRPAVPATAPTFVISSRATLEPRGTVLTLAAVSRCASGATRRRNTFANGVYTLTPLLPVNTRSFVLQFY